MLIVFVIICRTFIMLSLLKFAYINWNAVLVGTGTVLKGVSSQLFISYVFSLFNPQFLYVFYVTNFDLAIW